MKDFIREVVDECLQEGDDPFQEIDEIFNHEMNFNNADKTSGQRCMEHNEIEEEIIKLVNRK